MGVFFVSSYMFSQGHDVRISPFHQRC